MAAATHASQVKAGHEAVSFPPASDSRRARAWPSPPHADRRFQTANAGQEDPHASPRSGRTAAQQTADLAAAARKPTKDPSLRTSSLCSSLLADVARRVLSQFICEVLAKASLSPQCMPHDTTPF